ncbi:MAG: hypothetical protein CL946_06685 [Ectothiorhodospiraceae bacterium]|nr:hypothetical protein [Ectothiorhodospiraceae bacterium]
MPENTHLPTEGNEYESERPTAEEAGLTAGIWRGPLMGLLLVLGGALIIVIALTFFQSSLPTTTLQPKFGFVYLDEEIVASEELLSRGNVVEVAVGSGADIIFGSDTIRIEEESRITVLSDGFRIEEGSVIYIGPLGANVVTKGDEIRVGETD